jgi:hypothetical protein
LRNRTGDKLLPSLWRDREPDCPAALLDDIGALSSLSFLPRRASTAISW